MKLLSSEEESLLSRYIFSMKWQWIFVGSCVKLAPGSLNLLFIFVFILDFIYKHWLRLKIST